VLIHQSDLAAWGRCPAEYGYARAGLPNKTNSAAAFGSVMHVALLQVFERERAMGTPVELATKKALDTFLYYWHPTHIESICEPIPPDGFLPRQSVAELRTRGVDTIRKYGDLVKFAGVELLATEYSFLVPIPGTWDDGLGEPHMLAGSVDKLVAEHYKRALVLGIHDVKTGKEQVYLRHNLQFSAYCLASTLPEFWTGYRGEDGFGEQRGRELFDRFVGKARRGTWIDLRNFKIRDAGWRGPRDYERFKLAVGQLTASIEADIFPLVLSGATCQFCAYRNVCGGTGIPDDDHGRPV
jgi:hypothetical protein